MKIIKSLLLLLCISFSHSTFSQLQLAYPHVGIDGDSRYSSSIKIGGSLLGTSQGEQTWFAYTPSAEVKYNFVNNNIGGQLSIALSNFIGDNDPKFANYLGIKTVLDYEYDTEIKEGDFSVAALGGYSFLGVIEIMIGPKFNITKNLDPASIRLQLGVKSFIPFFQTSSIKTKRKNLMERFR